MDFSSKGGSRVYKQFHDMIANDDSEHVTGSRDGRVRSHDNLERSHDGQARLRENWEVPHHERRLHNGTGNPSEQQQQRSHEQYQRSHEQYQRSHEQQLHGYSQKSHDPMVGLGGVGHNYRQTRPVPPLNTMAESSEFPLPNSPAPPPYKSPSPDSVQAQVLQQLSQQSRHVPRSQFLYHSSVLGMGPEEHATDFSVDNVTSGSAGSDGVNTRMKSLSLHQPPVTQRARSPGRRRKVESKLQQRVETDSVADVNKAEPVARRSGGEEPVARRSGGEEPVARSSGASGNLDDDADIMRELDALMGGVEAMVSEANTDAAETFGRRDGSPPQANAEERFVGESGTSPRSGVEETFVGESGTPPRPGAEETFVGEGGIPPRSGAEETFIGESGIPPQSGAEEQTTPVSIDLQPADEEVMSMAESTGEERESEGGRRREEMDIPPNLCTPPQLRSSHLARMEFEVEISPPPGFRGSFLADPNDKESEHVVPPSNPTSREEEEEEEEEEEREDLPLPPPIERRYTEDNFADVSVYSTDSGIHAFCCCCCCFCTVHLLLLLLLLYIHMWYSHK